MLVAGAIAAIWHLLGRPVALPPSPLAAGEKLTCMSYTPFHDGQSPYMEGLHIPDGQIAGDMKRLAAVTSCVRTYSALGPQRRIVRYAAQDGMKVLQGIWLSRNRADNRREIESALALARQHPGVIKALIVGNETLLRGELSADDVKAYLAEVRRRSQLPVTYADVWEYWVDNAELADAVDFVTIHILPYWEDDPVAADQAVAHVRKVRESIEKKFPGKEIWIGEVGWPSQGRMRERALPSRVNQARVMSEILAAAKQEGWRVNVIEAFDQPWKRTLEGTAGGYWGLFDDAKREPKFHFGEPISNFPHWSAIAKLGVLAAFLVFGAAWLGGTNEAPRRRWWDDAPVALIALASGLTFGLAAIRLPIDSIETGDIIRSVLMLTLALAVPAACGFMFVRGSGLPAFATALDGSGWRRSPAAALFALLLIATAAAALHVALGLVFDPRYKDFPVTFLTGPSVALAVVGFAQPRGPVRPGVPETAMATALAASALFIVFNETAANWQAVWFGLLLILLSLAVLRARALRG
jgi:glucan 1,3-beta-glucosidase